MRLARHCIAAVLPIIAALSLAAFTAGAAAQSFARFDHPEIESLGGIFGIAQDGQGYIWLSGKNGVRRFDGYSATAFRAAAGQAGALAGNDIGAMTADFAGNIWVSVLGGGGLQRFDPARQRFQSYPITPAGDTDLNIYAIAPDPSGVLWLGTQARGLLRLDPASGAVKVWNGAALGLDSVAIRDLARDGRGRLWLATEAHGLAMFDPATGAVSHFRADPDNPESLHSDSLYRVWIDHFGVLWAGGMSGGLSRLEPDGRDFTRFGGGGRSHPLAAGMIWSIAEDALGNVWVATGSGAVCMFDKWRGEFDCQVLARARGERPDSTVIALYLDDAGDLWHGTYGSALHLRSERLPAFGKLRKDADPDRGLLSNDVTALAEARDGAILIGTEEGLTRYQVNTGEFQHWRSDEALPSAPVRALAVDAAGSIFVGTAGDGLWWRPPQAERFEPVPLPAPLADSRVWTLLAEPDGTLWIGTQGAGLYAWRREQNVLDHYAPGQSGLSHGFIWSLLRGPDGDLWIGTQWGLNRLEAATGEVTRLAVELVDPSVRSLAMGAAGEVWAGTPTGLHRIDPAQLSTTYYHVGDGLPDDNITGVSVDIRGFVWVTHQLGISRLGPDAGHRNFDIRYGIAGNAHPRRAALLHRAGGDLWFGGAGGITIVDPTAIAASPFVPPVVLTDLWLNNKHPEALPHIGTLDRVVIEPDTRVVTVEFAALNYVVPSQNRYAYRLEGFEKDWHLVSADQRRVTYTNLDAGDYRLAVRGASNEGLWNPTARYLTLRVKAPWWRTSAAYLCYAALLALLIGASSRRARLRLARAHNAREQEEDRRQLQTSQLRSVTRELEEPLAGLQGLTEHLQRGGAGPLPAAAERTLKLMAEATERLASGVASLKLFGAENHGGADLHCQALRLAPLLNEAVRDLAPLASARQVQLYSAQLDALPTVYADRSRTQQILLQALAYCLRRMRQGHIEIEAQAEGAVVVVRLTCFGLELDQADSDKLLAQAESAPQAGALAASIHWARRQGGALHLQTLVGSSVVAIDLPIYQAPKNIDPPSPAGAS